MGRGQDAARADQGSGTSCTAPGAEIAAKMNERVPWKSGRPRLMDARIHGTDEGKVTVLAVPFDIPAEGLGIEHSATAFRSLRFRRPAVFARSSREER